MATGGNNLDQCAKEAEKVTQIMLENYSKVLDREGKLTELDERAEDLRNQSVVFNKTSKAVAQKQRWKNMKWKIILGVVVAVVIFIIILAIVLAIDFSGSGNPEAAAKASPGGN